MSDRGQSSDGSTAGATAAAADSTQDGTSRDTSQNSSTDRPRIEFNEEQNAEINRIVRAKEQAAVARAKEAWDADVKRAEAEKSGQFEGLLRQTEKERDTVQERLKVALARSTVIDAAVAAGADSPEAAWRLVKDDLQFNADGEPTNVAELLLEAKQKYPGAFSAKKADGRAGDGGHRGTPQGDADMDTLIRRVIGRGAS